VIIAADVGFLHHDMMNMYTPVIWMSLTTSDKHQHRAAAAADALYSSAYSVSR